MATSVREPIGQTAKQTSSRFVLGRPRRIAVLGLAVGLAVGISLGVAVPSVVERALLDARLELYENVVGELVQGGVIASALAAGDTVALAEEIGDHLVGSDVVGVKVWDRTGTRVYADLGDVVGAKGGFSRDVESALGGTPIISKPQPDEIGVVSSTRRGAIHEYYVPITDSTGTVAGVFEVYEQAASIQGTLTAVRWLVWVGLGLGLAIVVVFLVSLSTANHRLLDHRRRQAERLVAEAARAQESERLRVIGALHDDIGQPLYRVLYSIEGSLSQCDSGSPVAAELARAADLVRSVDGALRSELLMLHQGGTDENDLDTLLRHLVDDVRSETHLTIDLTINDHDLLEEGSRAALFRATREAVTNARKHSGASKVDITVTQGSRRVIVDVEDDGSGFGGDLGLGLTTTRDRLEALGGGLEVRNVRTGGTLFRAWVSLTVGGVRW